MRDLKTRKSVYNRVSKISYKKRVKINSLFVLVCFILVNIAALLYFSYPNLENKSQDNNFDIPPVFKEWKYIIVHHGGGKTQQGDAASYDRFHKKKYNTGLLYHFVIGNGKGRSGDGDIEIGFRWKEQISGAHVSNVEYQKDAIGICLVGDLNHFHPTHTQMSKLVALVNYLIGHYDIHPQHVYTHHQLVRTACPGKLFPEEQFFQAIRLTGPLQLTHAVIPFLSKH